MYPDVRPPDRSEVRKGALLIVAMIVAAGAVFVSDVLERLLVEGPELSLIAPRASELEAGSAVWVAGTQAGRILDVGFLDPEAGDDRLLIRSVLRRDVGRAIREDATAIVRSSSLLAPNVLSIDPGDPDLPAFDFRDTLRVSIPFSTDILLAAADSVWAEVAVLRPLAVTLRHRLRDGPGTWAALRRDSALQAKLRDGLGALERLEAAAQGDGTVGRLRRDTALATTFRSSLARARGAVRGEPAQAWLEEGGALATRMRSIGARLERLHTRLREAEGAAGRFKYDSELADQIDLLRARLDSATVELMSDPFRWLRFRLF